MKIVRKLHEETTDFQKIEIYETTDFGNFMVIDGFTMVTTRDNFLYHEMMSHPPLFTHPQPSNVLVIGGGDCGTLREVLKHPEVTKAQLVEIDERVTRLSEQYFPELCSANNDPRAELHFVDGIKWVADAEPGSYDVIIVDSTDPIGPAEGLFNEAFYRNCHKALGEHGILVQQSESPLYHLNLIHEMRTAMRNSGFSDLRTYDFPQPIYPTGWWSATMARKTGRFDAIREHEADNRPFKTRYYSLARHRVSMEDLPVVVESE
ncbi:MAG: polyamine aminopropyltransferase [Gammaproteobacteria bacterium]